MVIYTDGSQETDQTGTPTGAGAGWVISWVDSWHGRRGIPLGDTHEVYDAEAVALFEGLKEALNSPIARVAPEIHICLDNLSVACNAGQIPKGSSQGVFKKFKDAAKTWLETGRRMTVQWIPGHTGIEGNEIADKEAKKQAKLLPSPKQE